MNDLAVKIDVSQSAIARPFGIGSTVEPQKGTPMNRIVTRVGLGLSFVVALGLAPAVTAQAATPAAATAMTQRHGHRCGCAEVTYPALVKRCSGRFTRALHADLLRAGEIWAPHFEPTLTAFGRAGEFFVYVGNTPVGWISMDTHFGGTITLTTEYGDYEKGRQRIAVYDARGRLLAWDWITLDWDW